MTLEDFEKALAVERDDRNSKGSSHDRGTGKKHSQHGRHHHRSHHHAKDEDHHSRKRKRSREREHKRSHFKDRQSDPHAKLVSPEDQLPVPDTGNPESVGHSGPKRDSWMEGPSGLEIDYVEQASNKRPADIVTSSRPKDVNLKVHEKELNKHYLQDLEDAEESPIELDNDSPVRKINYVFGDAGSQWRMTKLKAVYRKSEEEARRLEDVALEQFGNLQDFDDAREEEIELDRRSRYGPDYIGKEKPNGDLFEERKLQAGIRKHHQEQNSGEKKATSIETMKTATHSAISLPLDQTALNKMKAIMLKAKIRGGPEAERLEGEYNEALAKFASSKESDIVVLGAMENRMLTGGREGEVTAVDTKRGRARGTVEENEDMTVEDMVREERRTRGQAGGDGLRLAQRIAKDGKFDNDLDYMDENAVKLAKRVHKSEINLKNTAISDFRKLNRILDNCSLCHREDTNSPPIAPIVSLATRTYLTLPTEPEVSDGGGASIIPIQHRSNLLECDDDEWEEIRNFMKSLTRMYHDQGRAVIFYENAATPHRHRHAGLEAVPLPYSLGDIAPQFFKEAILAADEEWTQHKKIIDTLARAKSGLGKLAFRRTLVKEMPYFHVWFEIDGGLGHVIEDENRWPKGDLFAREIIGGMLDKGPDVIKRQGRWRRDDSRVDGFRKRWRKFDWTRVLTDT